MFSQTPASFIPYVVFQQTSSAFLKKLCAFYYAKRESECMNNSCARKVENGDIAVGASAHSSCCGGG